MRFCRGFVSGVEEASRLLARQQRLTGPVNICAPEGATARDFADAFINYAGKRKDLDQPAAAVVIKALESRYPCR